MELDPTCIRALVLNIADYSRRFVTRIKSVGIETYTENELCRATASTPHQPELYINTLIHHNRSLLSSPIPVSAQPWRPYERDTTIDFSCVASKLINTSHLPLPPRSMLGVRLRCTGYCLATLLVKKRGRALVQINHCDFEFLEPGLVQRA